MKLLEYVWCIINSHPQQVDVKEKVACPSPGLRSGLLIAPRHTDPHFFSLICRCKKWGVPIEKIYNKTQREKFAWAIDMADEDYEF